MEVNSILTLEGKTRKGKNRIRENGEKWMVLDVREAVGFTDEKGPWLLMTPVGGHPNNYRWIHRANDTDFTIKQ